MMTPIKHANIAVDPEAATASVPPAKLTLPLLTTKPQEGKSPLEDLTALGSMLERTDANMKRAYARPARGFD